MQVNELCEKMAGRHVEQHYPENNDETAFHDFSSFQFDSLVSSHSKLSTSQKALKKQVEAVSKRLNNTSLKNATTNSSHERGTSRGNYRRRNFAFNLARMGKIVATSSRTTIQKTRIGPQIQHHTTGTALTTPSHSISNHGGTRAVKIKHGTHTMKQWQSPLQFIAVPVTPLFMPLFNVTNGPQRNMGPNFLINGGKFQKTR